jgi:hypothetical protein
MLTFQEMIQAPVARDLKLWTDAQSRTAGLGDRDGFHDPLIVALDVSAAVHGIIIIQDIYREVQSPLVERAEAVQLHMALPIQV